MDDRGPTSRLERWLIAARVYRDRRVLALLFLGFSSGLPFGVLAEPLTARLSDAGVDLTTIGLFALVSLPYSLKFLWAPIIDQLRLPFFSKRFGRRRGWLLATQLALMAAIVGTGLTAPEVNPWATAALALCVAFASASQDIVFDAYRVEILSPEKLAAGAATTVFGWRLGQVGAGAAGLILADLLAWEMVFAILAALVLVGVVAILCNPEPSPPPDLGRSEAATDRDLAAKLHYAVIEPLRDFTRRPAWAAIIAFILLYKFGDAVLAVMKVPFFLDLGFTKTQIAEVAKLFGVVATIGGGFLGGIVLARFGIHLGLMVTGIGMAASNLVFVYLAQAGPDVTALTITIAVENVTTGMGTTAFVAYLSSLCSQAFTATQYALLSSLMALSRTVMSSGAGWVAERTDWIAFFILTTLAALPGLMLLAWMMRRYPPAEIEKP